MSRPGIPGRTGGLNRNTPLSALNEIIKRLQALNSLSSGSPTLPPGASTLSEQQVQTTELNSMNGTLTSLLNNLVASQDVEILLVRDTGDSDVVVQQIREYDQGTGLWTTRYEKVDGSAHTVIGPLVYLDPSAILNLILTELQSSVDYEVLRCYGRDSDIYDPFVHLVGQVSSTQYVGGAFPDPTIGVVPSLDEITITQTNNSYYVEFNIDGNFSSRDIIDIFIDASITAGGTMTTNTIELRDTVGGNLLDSATVLIGASPTTTETAQLTYDNTTVNYSTFTIRIYPVDFGGSTTVYDNFVMLNPGALSDPNQAIISKVDKYEDNILVDTSYFDYLDNPYTLIGSFVKDDRLTATELLRDSLTQISQSTADISKLVSHNTHTSFVLPLGTLPIAYIGFKELTFTVLSGTVNVAIGAGTNLTYPLNVASGGVVAGQTILADDVDISGVQLDPTLGSVLITIKT
jgi:hypothetical protein